MPTLTNAYSLDHEMQEGSCPLCQQGPMLSGEEGNLCENCEVLFRTHHYGHGRYCGRLGHFIALAVPKDRVDGYENRLQVITDEEKRRQIFNQLFNCDDLDNYEIMESTDPNQLYYVRTAKDGFVDDSTCWVWYCEHCQEKFNGHCD